MSNEEKTEKKYKVCKYVDGKYLCTTASDLTLKEAKEFRIFVETKYPHSNVSYRILKQTNEG